jgi:hypothetical protein
MSDEGPLKAMWRTRATWLAPVLSLLAFWSGLGLAARAYPSEYDWRYMTISTLLYRDRNPHGYGWGRTGLVACALFGLWWVLRSGGRAGRLNGLLVGGYLGMMLCALVPSPFFGLEKPHEWLAVTGFLCMCVAATGLALAARSSQRSGPWRPAWLLASIVPLLPVAAAAVSQSYASHAHLPWVSLAWRTRGIPAYWSFAFWEWLACAGCTCSLLWSEVLGAFRVVAADQRS